MSSLPLDRLRGGSAGFARDPRFAATLSDAGAYPAADPQGEAYARGYAEGAAQARVEAEAAAATREAQLSAIELSFATWDKASAAALRERLRQTVLALCEEAIMPMALDAGSLALRIDRACEMLQRAQDERRVMLNPEDLDLLAGRLPADLNVAADPMVERGALRIETADGGIEDGPAQWRRILAEAFREC